jgi:hypothetical protein
MPTTGQLGHGIRRGCSGHAAWHAGTGNLSLSQWCWQVCDRESLAVAMAATNYAIEGATGEWSARVCSKTVMPSCLMSRCVPRP